MPKSLVITVGPIPAKLDSVKLITNKFKGGLALKTAKALQKTHQVTILAHESTTIAPDGFDPETKIVRVEDVMDCYEKLRIIEADTYVLAGAVANLMPLKPWKGKFPSHNYKVGEEFQITFTIAPRAIDKIRRWHPGATLIGYKLFDGTKAELIAAGKETLRESKAHVVFCNHPSWAKEKKIALTQDGAVMDMSFDDHIALIEKVSLLAWYKTDANGAEWMNPQKETLTNLVEALGTPEGNLLLGCAAYRHGAGFITTARGKSNASQHVFVEHVDHENRIVTASGKATLNAPTLARIFDLHPKLSWILHGHQLLADHPTFGYEFPGSVEESKCVQNSCLRNHLGQSYHIFNILHHGFYAGFETLEQAWNFTALLKTGGVPEVKKPTVQSPPEPLPLFDLMSGHPSSIPSILENPLQGLTYGTIIGIKYADESLLKLDTAKGRNNKWEGSISTQDGRPMAKTPPIFTSKDEALQHLNLIIETAKVYDPKRPSTAPDAV